MTTSSRRKRIVIAGAAGRDFHDFNVVYRNDDSVEVVAFTATQIPGIADRRYPGALAGSLYPDGIPIEAEDGLETICRARDVDEVVLAYSDIDHATVMHLASRALAAGADFALLGPRATMLAASVPVIAVTAVRTGCGKSQISRWLSGWLAARGHRVAAVRHPMPYGDLTAQAVQRFATMADLDAADCTQEEREEYEPHIAAGGIIYAGVDYGRILEQAEREADIIVWDGGNNDFAFFRPDLNIVVADALRPDQITTHHPGEACVRMADAFVVNKVDVAIPDEVERTVQNLRAVNPGATVVRAASPVHLDDPTLVEDRRVLVIEDGPTITHGQMAYGAGFVAAMAAGAADIVDPRQFAVPEIRAIYERYPHIGPVLPDVGYDREQLGALEATIFAADVDVVVIASPVDLAAEIRIDKPWVRARYDFADAGEPTLAAVVDKFLSAADAGA
ncbi:MAG: cyclic 2,3-diphosphoglycerate synthase [Alphaproteobacteria bacterium]|nr:cyclic 2,3-diphosphoglycerate synthase [Alphaproteobacteria bacterium]